jgi:SAM-dependent methyltransferase
MRSENRRSENPYSRAFYRSIAGESLKAAELIAPLLGPLRVTSVVDFGCGSGTWLRAFRANGAAIVHGMDQFDPANVRLLIEPEEYQRVDLTNDVQLPLQYDLALSLEVGEHLPPRASRTLVSNLAKASGRILFSAATPGQGGVDHVNERALSDWVEMFAEHGYVASDFIRLAIAQRRLEIEPWYRYNTLFFFRESDAASIPAFVTDALIKDPRDLTRRVALAWRLRCALLAALPVPAVTFLANWKHNLRGRS